MDSHWYGDFIVSVARRSVGPGAFEHTARHIVGRDHPPRLVSLGGCEVSPQIPLPPPRDCRVSRLKYGASLSLGTAIPGCQRRYSKSEVVPALVAPITRKSKSRLILGWGTRCDKLARESLRTLGRRCATSLWT